MYIRIIFENNITGDNMNILYTGARSGLASHTINKLKKDKNNYIYVTVHTNKQLKCVEKTYKDDKNIKCFKLDIKDKNDRKQLYDLDIDVLICNAAIGEGGSVAEIPVSKVRDNFETNVFSNIEVIQIILKNMIKKKSGKIIIISSLAGIIPLSFLGSYCSTKASLIMLGKCLNKELKLINKNIKVSIIEPGLYKTGFNDVMLNNKYDWMDIDSYFKYQINYIRRKENIIFNLLEHKNYNSVSNKIIKCIKSNNPKLVYKVPLLQGLGAKTYQIFSK